MDTWYFRVERPETLQAPLVAKADAPKSNVRRRVLRRPILRKPVGAEAGTWKRFVPDRQTAGEERACKCSRHSARETSHKGANTNVNIVGSGLSITPTGLKAPTASCLIHGSHLKTSRYHSPAISIRARDQACSVSPEVRRVRDRSSPGSAYDITSNDIR